MRSEAHSPYITPSVLDRLLDDSPKESVEAPQTAAFDLRRYKQSVARDMGALLNARCVDLDEVIEEYPQARTSMINFGIIDLSSLSLLDPNDRALLRDKIRITLERHEPRLAKIRVTLDIPKTGERMLRFRVDAVLKVHPNKPAITFDATLQLSSNTYAIREQ